MEILRSLGAGMSQVLSVHPFAVLACLPGFIAIFNMIAVKIRFNKTAQELRKVAESNNKGSRKRVRPLFESDLAEYSPRWWYTIFGALSLTVVFGIVAALGGHRLPTDFGVRKIVAPGDSRQIGQAIPPAAGGATVQVAQGEQVGVVGQTSTTRRGSGPESGRSVQDETSVVGGIEGLIYAGYGAYIYTMLLVISRLNSAALTGKFLAVSAVRSAIALVLGFTAADTNIFAGLSTNQGLFVLFFIGLFPSWAMDALRKKGQDIFKTSATGCDILPLCLIDGLDDGIADRLAETGLWDVEHMANSDPFGLAAKTLYPLRRIIDWIDQAALISYVRREIIHFRACGIRGAIDYAALYRDSMGIASSDKDPEPSLQDRAGQLIKILAQKTNLPEAALLVIGRNLYEDAVVGSLWNLWFNDDLESDGRREELQNLP